MAAGAHQSPRKKADVRKIAVIVAAAVAAIALIVLGAAFIFDGEEKPARPSTPLDPTGTGSAPAAYVSVVTADGSTVGDLSLKVGDSLELTAIITPDGPADRPVWTSSDGTVVSVASLDDAGRRARLTCGGAGGAVVTVSVGAAKYEFTVTGEEETLPTGPPGEPEQPEYMNPLTGLAAGTDISGMRPFAIMFNNIKKATPQAGISQADMIFEIPVEGGITRLMGIYQGFKTADVIGSVRSARPYFVDIARGFDAIYIHAGGSDDAYASIKSSGITHIDGVNGSGVTFFRDKDRMKNMGYEHSLMLDVPKVEPYLAKTGSRVAHKDGYSAGFTFAEAGEPVGTPAKKVEAMFGGKKSTLFEYDSASKLYKVSQFDAPMIDGNTGEQLAVRNVVVIRVRISRIAGDSEGRLKANLTGSGSGWYMAGGAIQTISWKRTSDGAQFTFTDQDGGELAFAPGVTYFAVLPASSGGIQVSE